MDNTLIPLNDVIPEAEMAQYVKPFMFIKGFAMGRRLPQTQKALYLAQSLHNGQYRKDGTPYICHPLRNL